MIATRPRLVLLNGLPGSGKSTLASRYADAHPGTLRLDLDQLHPFVGGWRDWDLRTHDLLRPVALAMASAHLRGGRDEVAWARFDSSTEESEWAVFNRRVVADLGGRALFDRFESQLDALLASGVRAALLPADAVEHAYNALLRVIGAAGR